MALQIYRGESFDLKVGKDMWIPELSVGVLSHELELEVMFCTAMLIAASQDVMTQRNLLMHACVVESGPLYTVVFNLSQDGIKVPKGAVVSRLIGL